MRVQVPPANYEKTQVRRIEVKVSRDNVAARGNGSNVAKAQHQNWFGSTALTKGDRVKRLRHFKPADRDLRPHGANVGTK